MTATLRGSTRIPATAGFCTGCGSPSATRRSRTRPPPDSRYVLAGPGRTFTTCAITSPAPGSCYRPRYLNIQRLNYLRTIQQGSASIAQSPITDRNCPGCLGRARTRLMRSCRCKSERRSGRVFCSRPSFTHLGFGPSVRNRFWAVAATQSTAPGSWVHPGSPPLKYGRSSPIAYALVRRSARSRWRPGVDEDGNGHGGSDRDDRTPEHGDGEPVNCGRGHARREVGGQVAGRRSDGDGVEQGGTNG